MNGKVIPKDNVMGMAAFELGKARRRAAGTAIYEADAQRTIIRNVPPRDNPISRDVIAPMAAHSIGIANPNAINPEVT